MVDLNVEQEEGIQKIWGCNRPGELEMLAHRGYGFCLDERGEKITKDAGGGFLLYLMFTPKINYENIEIKDTCRDILMMIKKGCFTFSHHYPFILKKLRRCFEVRRLEIDDIDFFMAVVSRSSGYIIGDTHIIKYGFMNKCIDFVKLRWWRLFRVSFFKESPEILLRKPLLFYKHLQWLKLKIK